MTLAIVAVTCAITFAAWRSPRMLDRLVLFPPALTFRGQWDRLLGYGLVHADMWHLLFNMLTLLSFGAAAEAQNLVNGHGCGAEHHLDVESDLVERGHSEVLAGK